METINKKHYRVSKFEASIELLDPYLDLFDRLGRVLDKADEIDRENWTEPWCRKILCELKGEFARIKLPKRTTIWQMMLVEQCLQPLWDRITVDDLTTIANEVSRHASFRDRIVHIGYVIGYWHHLLQGQQVILKRVETGE